MRIGGYRFRSIRPTVVVLLFAASAASAESPAPSANLPIPEARWLAPEADALAELATAPAECLAVPDDPEAAHAVEIGRAAFRTPALLGGQAARAGLSCASCHRNGRDNPGFFFFGISGAPGSADVTSAFFSARRGDGVANPVPIPDLAGPRAQRKVGRAPASGALEAFIRGLVVEEFDGAEPPARVLAGLAAYVRALSPEACPSAPRAPVTAAGALADARRAVDAVRAAGDPETAALMLSAARAALGGVHARFAAAELAGLRERLRASDRSLAAAQAAVRRGEDPGIRLAAWRLDLAALAPELAAAEPASLFSPDVLSRALAE